MKLFLQLLPVAPTLLMLLGLIWLLRTMIHLTPPERWHKRPASTPILFQRPQSSHVSLTEKTARYLAHATAAVAGLRFVWPGLWRHITKQIDAVRTQLAGRADRNRIRYPLLPASFIPDGHHQPPSPMIAIDLTYTVVAHVSVTTKPGELDTQLHGTEVEYYHDLPHDHWRDGETLTPEGVNALMMGFVNGLMCTIRLGEELNGMNGAALLRESLDMMQQLFIAQGTVDPVSDLKK